MSDKPIIFISCGQFTQEEKALGQSIRALIDETGVFRGYFAENQSSLQGVTKNIFAQLDQCFGLICVMHNRGTVSSPNGKPTLRASVWIEQEIAIAAFLTEVLGKDIKTRVYLQEGIHREGVRDKVIINPKDFRTDIDILSDLPAILDEWSHQLSSNVTRGSQESLNHLLEELTDNYDLLVLDLSNFQALSDENFREFRKSTTFHDLELSLKDSIKQAYRDISNYTTHLITMQNIQNYGSRANHVGMYVGPAKEQAAKSVGEAIAGLNALISRGAYTPSR